MKKEKIPNLENITIDSLSSSAKRDPKLNPDASENRLLRRLYDLGTKTYYATRCNQPLHIPTFLQYQ